MPWSVKSTVSIMHLHTSVLSDGAGALTLLQQFATLAQGVSLHGKNSGTGDVFLLADVEPKKILASLEQPWLGSSLPTQNCGRKGLVALSKERLRGVFGAASFCFLKAQFR